MATSLTIKILTDVTDAVKGIDQVDGKTKGFSSSLGGVAAGIAGAFSVSKIQGWATEWVNSGMEANGALKNVKIAFGDAAGGVEEWGQTASSTFGTTAADAENMAAQMGIALQGYGVDAKTAASESEQLVNRAADIAKVFGTDTETVLSKVSSAMRGRTQGVKEYGVQIDKGSDSQKIFNDFMSQTSEVAGRSDTTMGTFHATMGDLSATLGQALVPVIMELMPLVQGIADWATNNHAAFVAIVLVLGGLAVAFGIAASAATIFAGATFAAMWPILLVIGGIAALVAIIVIVCKNWDTLCGWFSTAVGWFQTAWQWVQNVVDKLGVLVLAFGPIGAVILVINNFSTAWAAVKTAVDLVHDAISFVWDIAKTAATGGIDAFKTAWNGVKTAVDAVKSAIDAVWSIAGKVMDKIGSIASHIPGLHAADSAPAGAAGPSPYGAGATAAPVTFAPVINIAGDIGDPYLAGRRIVTALESWTAKNGRRRIAALVGP